MSSFGILGGADPLKSAFKIQADAAKFNASIGQADSKNTLASLGVTDTADFTNVLPAAAPASARSVAQVESSVKEMTAFLDSPEGRILQEIEAA